MNEREEQTSEDAGPDDSAARLKGQVLYLDCFAGIAGDMFRGAMLDLGVPEGLVREQLGRLPLAGYQLVVGRRSHHGIVGCDVQVKHDGGSHGHRAYRDVQAMIAGAGLAPRAESLALDMFVRVAQAEAKLHGVPVGEVTFHELGAVDSIVDVVGAAVALAYLRPVQVISRAVPLGRGRTSCAHGALPVPSPAALEILEGALVEDGGAEMELCTPTGAAIVAAAVGKFGPLPSGRVAAVGYGAGDRELPDRPNHLRVVVVQPAGAGDGADEAVVMEANVDDMNPEWCGHVAERLFRAGALDVWYTPIVMKKGRPALTLSALCTTRSRDAVANVMLAESTTIGLRLSSVTRRVLGRRWVEVETVYGELRIKEALDGDRAVNAAPELEDCRVLAEKADVPLKEVYAAAIAAYRRGR